MQLSGYWTSENASSRHLGEYGPLASFLGGFFGSARYLFRIDVAGEAGYDLTVWSAQDDDAWIADQVQTVAWR
jgi:hypothetical protein